MNQTSTTEYASKILEIVKHSDDGDYIEVSGGSYNSGDKTISQTMYCGNEGLGNRKVDMIHDPADHIYSQSPGIVSVLFRTDKNRDTSEDETKPEVGFRIGYEIENDCD